MLSPAAGPLAARADALLALLRGARGLLLAVSGGPDSMALLLCVAQWRARPPVFVATVDHGLRAGAADEAAFVGVAASALGLNHAILRWEGDKPATRLQERARAARYRLLAAHARANGCDTIVTAHHADDQAETVLMRLVRGSGPAGLAGMAALASTPGAPDLALARPFLGLVKAELVEVCRAAGQVFFDDPANRAAAQGRARLRRLAPVLAAEGLDRAALLRLAARAARAEAALAALIAEKLAALPVQRGARGCVLARADLCALPQEALVRLLMGEIEHMTGVAPRLERAERLAAALARACAQGEDWSATLGGALVRLAGRTCAIVPAPARKTRRPA